MQTSSELPSAMKTIPLQDFGELQKRYQSLKLANRAAAVLADAEPAMRASERILAALEAHKESKQAFEQLRKNALLIGRMRPSEAKNLLMDAGNDFTDVTRRKLAAWHKTMERISKGEGIVSEQQKEYIPSSEPLALALAGNSGVASFLSVVQLAIGELVKIDPAGEEKFKPMMAEIRRCATVLSDYENASSIHTLVN